MCRICVRKRKKDRVSLCLGCERKREGQSGRVFKLCERKRERDRVGVSLGYVNRR